MIAAYHIIVHGRVQGVGFRISTAHIAKRMGITGWVKNCVDGSVEIVCEGKSVDISQFITWCKKGPSYAHVQSLQTSPVSTMQHFTNFDIRY